MQRNVETKKDYVVYVEGTSRGKGMPGSEMALGEREVEWIPQSKEEADVSIILYILRPA